MQSINIYLYFVFYALLLVLASNCNHGAASNQVARFTIDNDEVSNWVAADSLFQLQLVPLSLDATQVVGYDLIYATWYDDALFVADRYRGLSKLSPIGEVMWNTGSVKMNLGEWNPIVYCYLDQATDEFVLGDSRGKSVYRYGTSGKFLGEHVVPLKHDNAISVNSNSVMYETKGYPVKSSETNTTYSHLALVNSGKVVATFLPDHRPRDNQRHYFFDHTFYRLHDRVYYSRPHSGSVYAYSDSTRAVTRVAEWHFREGHLAEDVFESSHVDDAFTYVADRNIALPVWTVTDGHYLVMSYDYNYQNNFTVIEREQTLLNTQYVLIDEVLVPGPSVHSQGLFATSMDRPTFELLQELVAMNFVVSPAWKEKFDRQLNTGVVTSEHVLILLRFSAWKSGD